MIVEASVTGVFRMILILLGVFVLVRFLGQILMAKNNLAKQQEMRRHEEAIAREKSKAQQNAGKTKILKNNKGGNSGNPTIDVDYTDVTD